MFCGKNKAITFSYDDGVTQDIRLIEIFNKYNLKATFNLNSELLGQSASIIRNNIHIRPFGNPILLHQRRYGKGGQAALPDSDESLQLY